MTNRAEGIESKQRAAAACEVMNFTVTIKDMSQAIVDPSELRRFAHNLKRFREDLHGSMATLHGQLLNLGDTWRDQEHARFIQEFEQTVALLERFMATSDQHVQFLSMKAERIEEYLQQR